MIYIGNSFSLQMMRTGTVDIAEADIREVSKEVVKGFPLGGVRFCVGHADTAAVAAGLLNEAIAADSTGWFELGTDQVFNRTSIRLERHDVLYVLQILGGRLPEGCTELPKGISMAWRKVTVR